MKSLSYPHRIFEKVFMISPGKIGAFSIARSTRISSGKLALENSRLSGR
jgi:hypothetical protein